MKAGRVASSGLPQTTGEAHGGQTNTYHCTLSKQTLGGAKNVFTTDPHRTAKPLHRPPLTNFGIV